MLKIRGEEIDRMLPKLNLLIKKRIALETTRNCWVKEPSTREKTELTEDLHLQSHLKSKRLKFSLRKERPKLLNRSLRRESLPNILSSSTWSQFILRKREISKRKSSSRKFVERKGKPLRKLCKVSSYLLELDLGEIQIWPRKIFLMTLLRVPLQQRYKKSPSEKLEDLKGRKVPLAGPL